MSAPVLSILILAAMFLLATVLPLNMGALAFVVVLWLTVLFVLFSVWPAIENGAIRTILVVAGGLVLLFNTAAIVAMLRHYHGDKVFIYSLDIMHLDEMRRRRRG